ncbi:CBO0543 family protein [Halalkalibacter hemicellulosilyticus]|uniref:Uncharacterized protein n=1 Tax=Halalkalibacter hemicellulosilyticusJCM 9152 TaxID=1236971 RepID=W4QFP4_9BACI|nr:CBO0543 family protein [Halalkalibacter hemicellulosilyticus]GAE30174.1 hypothetical protein JCM9152_1571 [Halalkalibacter hemicellulosilyticusJCM 9152]
MTNKFNQIGELQLQYANELMEYWQTYNLFSGLWWIIVFFNLLLMFVFIFLVDKNRITQMTLTLLFSFILIGIANETGNFFGKWNYPYQFIPFLETFNAVDFLSVPILIALTYQYFSKWISFLIANIILSAFLAFIGIPIAVRLNLYVLDDWTTFNSFIVLFVTAFLVKSISDYFKNKSQNSLEKDTVR